MKALANDLDQRVNAVVSPEFEVLAVAPNGRMYSLWSFGKGRVDQLASYDIQSGNFLGTQPMQIRTRSDILSSLMVSRDHLFQFDRIEAPGPFLAEDKLGVYSYALNDGLQLTGFLPCFESGEMILHFDDGPKQIHQVRACGKSSWPSREITHIFFVPLRSSQWILYHTHEEDFDRKILVNRNGTLSTSDSHRISFGLRNDVKLATANRVFVEDPNEKGTIKLDEYDIATGTKVRTILTGGPVEDYTLASVLSNGIEVVCIMKGRAGRPGNIIPKLRALVAACITSSKLHVCITGTDG